MISISILRNVSQYKSEKRTISKPLLLNTGQIVNELRMYGHSKPNCNDQLGQVKAKIKQMNKALDRIEQGLPFKETLVKDAYHTLILPFSDVCVDVSEQLQYDDFTFICKVNLNEIALEQNKPAKDQIVFTSLPRQSYYVSMLKIFF